MTVIRFLRLHSHSPDAKPEQRRDGVLAVAAIKEATGLARLLPVDMGPLAATTGPA